MTLDTLVSQSGGPVHSLQAQCLRRGTTRVKITHMALLLGRIPPTCTSYGVSSAATCITCMRTVVIAKTTAHIHIIRDFPSMNQEQGHRYSGVHAKTCVSTDV